MKEHWKLTWHREWILEDKGKFCKALSHCVQWNKPKDKGKSCQFQFLQQPKNSAKRRRKNQFQVTFGLILTKPFRKLIPTPKWLSHIRKTKQFVGVCFSNSHVKQTNKLCFSIYKQIFRQFSVRLPIFELAVVQTEFVFFSMFCVCEQRYVESGRLFYFVFQIKMLIDHHFHMWTLYALLSTVTLCFRMKNDVWILIKGQCSVIISSIEALNP